MSAGPELDRSATVRWMEVTSVDTVPLREGRKVRLARRELALFNLGGKYLAVENSCPHKGGPLSDGILSGNSVFCPLHNWKVSLTNGVVENPPGQTCRIKTYPVKIENSKVFLQIPDHPL